MMTLMVHPPLPMEVSEVEVEVEEERMTLSSGQVDYSVGCLRTSVAAFPSTCPTYGTDSTSKSSLPSFSSTSLASLAPSLSAEYSVSKKFLKLFEEFCRHFTLKFEGEKTEKHIGISETLVASAIAGMIFSVCSGQPLVIVGTTGPLLLFDESLYKVHDCRISTLVGA
jgi:hypothetical protein